MTTSHKNYKLIAAIRLAMKPEGNSAPGIADAVIGACYPETVKVSKREGAFALLRTGVVTFVRAYLKDGPHAVGADLVEDPAFWDIEPGFQEVATLMTHSEYYVPSVRDFVSKGKLIAFPDLFREAKAFMRSKGEETIEEADRLDLAYETMMRISRPGA